MFMKRSSLQASREHAPIISGSLKGKRDDAHASNKQFSNDDQFRNDANAGDKGEMF